MSEHQTALLLPRPVRHTLPRPTPRLRVHTHRSLMLSRNIPGLATARGAAPIEPPTTHSEAQQRLLQPAHKSHRAPSPAAAHHTHAGHRAPPRAHDHDDLLRVHTRLTHPTPHTTQATPSTHQHATTLSHAHARCMHPTSRPPHTDATASRRDTASGRECLHSAYKAPTIVPTKRLHSAESAERATNAERANSGLYNRNKNTRTIPNTPPPPPHDTRTRSAMRASRRQPHIIPNTDRVAR